MRLLFGFLFVLIVNNCFAQKGLFFTTSAGWNVSYNQISSDKPLPEGVVKYSKWSGFSSATGLEYRFSSHWSVHVQVKTASVELGLRTKSLWLDTASGKYAKNPGKGSTSLVGHAPAHFQLGATYYSPSSKSKEISWLAGGGIAYLIQSQGFAPEISKGVSSYSINGVRHYFPGKHILLYMEEEYRKRNGFLLNFHAGVDYQIAPNHHFLLTLQHNIGLRNIWQFKSEYFTLMDVKPDQNITYEHYQVKLRTKGSYSALQLGYKYALTGRKKS